MKIINAIVAFAKSIQTARKERLYNQAAADAYAMMLSHDPNKYRERRY